MAIITISRGTMSGGEALASRVSEKLGWPAVSREVVTEAAEQFGVSEKEMSENLRRNPGFFGKGSIDRWLYLTALRSALVERATRGSFIYHGLAGHLLLKGVPGVLKVRLIAPLEFRLKMLRVKDGVTREAALAQIERVDRERRDWTRFLYDVDWTDPSIYDVVFNLISLTIEDVADAVCVAVRAPAFADTPECRQLFGQCSLACKVKAALVRNPHTRGLGLEAEVAGTKARITGTVPTGGIFGPHLETARREIAELARSVPGVSSVEVDLTESYVPVD
ncbi:MAG: cytidylate kinase family protein [Candidatus Riflebacteria bacterium]|nr:cytidylate kinase family protein [Candidatus Riflebacteria bacterium]